MTGFGVLFPKGADDHASIDLPKEVKGYWITGESLSTRPLIPTGVEEERWVFMTPGPRYKRVRDGSVPADNHLSSGSTHKSNNGKCHDFENKKGKDFFVQSIIYIICVA